MNGERYVKFCMAVEHMEKALQKYKNEKLAAFGLRSMHLMFLFQLSRAKEGLTGTELATNCSVDKAFISRVTTEMSNLAYVEYLDKTGSRYKNKLVLTEKGRKVMEQISTLIDETIADVTAGISAEQFGTFYDVLDTVNRNLEYSLAKD